MDHHHMCVSALTITQRLTYCFLLLLLCFPPLRPLFLFLTLFFLSFFFFSLLSHSPTLLFLFPHPSQCRTTEQPTPPPPELATKSPRPSSTTARSTTPRPTIPSTVAPLSTSTPTARDTLPSGSS